MCVWLFLPLFLLFWQLLTFCHFLSSSSTTCPVMAPIIHQPCSNMIMIRWWREGKGNCETLSTFVNTDLCASLPFHKHQRSKIIFEHLAQTQMYSLTSHSTKQLLGFCRKRDPLQIGGKATPPSQAQPARQAASWLIFCSFIGSPVICLNRLKPFCFIKKSQIVAGIKSSNEFDSLSSLIIMDGGMKSTLRWGV